MPELIDGEVVDTYGGDYTYRYVFYEKEGDEYFFYEYFTGAKASPQEQITDSEEIAEFMKMVKE